jgi:hypothetical protein
MVIGFFGGHAMGGSKHRHCGGALNGGFGGFGGATIGWCSVVVAWWWWWWERERGVIADLQEKKKKVFVMIFFLEMVIFSD